MKSRKTFNVILDSGAKIIKFNDPHNITGYSSNEVIGKNWFEVFIPEVDMQKILKVFQSIFFGSQDFWEYQNLIRHKSGFELETHFNNKILLDDNNQREYISFDAYII